MIHKAQSAPSIPFLEEAAHNQTNEASQEGDAGRASDSSITRKPSLSKALLKPFVSRLPYLQSLPSMPSLRPKLSIVTTQIPPVQTAGTADSGWEGDTEDEKEEEEADGDEDGGKGEETSPLSAVPPSNIPTATGGRELQSCLRHSSSSKSKKSNKVTFSFTSEESKTDGQHNHDHGDGDSGEQSSSSSASSKTKKQKSKNGVRRRRRRDSFLTSLARPLRSPLLLLSPSTAQQPKPVRIFLEALPCPNKDPSIRSSYPHPLLLDLNDLVSSSNLSNPSSNSNSSSSSSNSFFETLDLAARQTLFYADEVLYAPLKQNRYDGAATHVPWNDARLRDLARFWLQPEDGWEVLFRCEVLPWLGWFGLEDGKISEEWWDRSVVDEGGRERDKTGRKTATATTNLMTRTLSRKGKEVVGEGSSNSSGSGGGGGGGGEERKKKKDGDGVDDDNGDDDWVCFSRKDGVMRIDLVVKFGYRPPLPCLDE